MRGVTRLRDSSGFSLIEVMIAALIVVIGAGAAFSLIDSANRAVSSNSARIGATNLSRELSEYARGVDYDLLQSGQVVPAMRQHDTIKGVLSGGAWNVERRGVTYTIATSVCTFDDPKDGLSATPPTNPCPAAAAVADAPTEVNPDDFRKVTFTLSWVARGRAGKTTQSTLVVNPNGGLGPQIITFTPPSNQITAGTSVEWSSATLPLTSTSAAAVHWTTDDLSGGDAAGGPTSWGFTWDLGTRFSATAPWVKDGTYTVQAQAFDSRGVPGEAKLVTVHVNRGIPGEVPGLVSGYNAALKAVEMRWKRYDERDLQGYYVIRTADNKQICPAAGGLQEGLSCADPDPLDSSTYEVYAADCENLMTGFDCEREGVATVTPPRGKAEPSDPTPPDQPTGLTASVLDGKPTLAWTAPDPGPNGPIRFYRIYRDTGTTLADRYDETVTNAPSYTDPNPGSTTAHTYWVTAVDQNFNESIVSDPVLSPPVS
jgi:prepilin-type N-terminal cleavage/methylation domain-containing protein